MVDLFRILFIACIVAAAVHDLRERRIPNAVTFGAAVLALAAHVAASGAAGLAPWSFGLLTGAGLLIIPCAMGGMGLGDLKLLAAAGSMLGPFPVLCAFLAAAVVGSLLACGALAARRAAPAYELPADAGERRLHVPYGLPLAAGVLLSAAGAWIR